jgi:hypothetical protein
MIRIARGRGRNRAPRTASSFGYALLAATAQHLIVRGLKRRSHATIIEPVQLAVSIPAGLKVRGGADGDAKRIWAPVMLDRWHRELIDAPEPAATGAPA